jgi:hypothetical protein
MLVLQDQSRTKSRRQAFVDQINAAGTHVTCGLAYRTLLNGSRRSGNANHHMRAPVSIANAPQKRFQHFLRYLEIVDRAAADWPVNFGLAWLAAHEF